MTSLYTTTGKLVYEVKVTATIACPMVLSIFPADVALCPIGLESFAYAALAIKHVTLVRISTN